MTAQVNTSTTLPFEGYESQHTQVNYTIPKGIGCLVLSILIPLGIQLSTGKALTFAAYPLSMVGAVLLSVIGTIYLIAGVIELFLPDPVPEKKDQPSQESPKAMSTPSTPKVSTSSITDPHFFDDGYSTTKKTEESSGIQLGFSPQSPHTPSSTVSFSNSPSIYITPNGDSNSSTESSPDPSPMAFSSPTESHFFSFTNSPEKFDCDFDEWTPPED